MSQTLHQLLTLLTDLFCDVPKELAKKIVKANKKNKRNIFIQELRDKISSCKVKCCSKTFIFLYHMRNTKIRDGIPFVNNACVTFLCFPLSKQSYVLTTHLCTTSDEQEIMRRAENLLFSPYDLHKKHHFP